MITNFDLLHESIGSKLAKTAGIVGGGLIGLGIGDQLLNANVLNLPTTPQEHIRNTLDLPVYKYNSIDAVGPRRLTTLGAAGLSEIIGGLGGYKLANKFLNKK